MRVTDSLVFQSAMIDTARAREAAQQAQQLASTGARLTHPSDDPAGAGLLVAFHMDEARFTAIAGAASSASDELSAADAALGDIATSLSRAKELAVQFGSAGHTQDQAAAGALEIGTLISQIVSDLNTRFGSRYLFGGNQDGAAPFDSAGGYHGDLGAAGIRRVEIAPGVLQQANVQADAAVGLGGGTDLFQVLHALQSAMQLNDTAAIRGTLDGLDAGIGQIAAARSQGGAFQHAFDTAVTASTNMSDAAKVSAGKVGDADLIESAIQLQATQTALEAALSATAQSFKLSLLDYL